MFDTANENLIYKEVGDRKLMLTFLAPLRKVYEKAPVYFIIPGGGWHTVSRQSMLDFSEKSVEVLRKSGFAVVSIDYRVVREDCVVMSDIIADCFDALEYVAHFADVLGIDKNKIALAGHSAGGHLALMLAYALSEEFYKGYKYTDNYEVCCVAAMSPPTILYENSMGQTLNLKDIDDCFHCSDIMQAKKQLSPYEYVSEKCPPTLLAAGTSDRLVFSNSSEMLYERLIHYGVNAKLLLSVGGGHSFEKMHASVEPSISKESIQDSIISFILENI